MRESMAIGTASRLRGPRLRPLADITDRAKATMMTLGTRLYTWLRGEQVGSDAAGNRYYRDKTGASRADGLREKRWVVYNGEVEASRVPAEWHGWLHHSVKEPPPAGGPAIRAWQKPHQPNATGTADAYRPPGHDFKGGRRAAATGDYEPWTPS